MTPSDRPECRNGRRLCMTRPSRPSQHNSAIASGGTCSLLSRAERAERRRSVAISAGRVPPGALRRHPTAPHGLDARPARRVVWHRLRPLARRVSGWSLLRFQLPVETTQVERFAMWAPRGRPTAVGTRRLEPLRRSDRRAVRDRLPGVSGTGGHHLEARRASIRSATASISSRSPSSASRAATSAASSWLRRR